MPHWWELNAGASPHPFTHLHSWTPVAGVTADTLCSNGPLYSPRRRIYRRGYHRISFWNVLIWARRYLNMVFVYRYIRITEIRQLMNALKRRRPNWLNLRLISVFAGLRMSASRHTIPMTSSTLADLSPPLIKWWYIISAETSCKHVC